MKKVHVLLVCIFAAFALQAQQLPVSGKVVDQNGEGLPGATVVVKGTTQGTTTDLNGGFSLNVDASAVLSVSYVGYATQDVNVGGQSTLQIQMQVDAEQLEEVVVVGYGEQKKVNLTGSVAVIDAKDLAKQAVFQTSQALQGISPGLTAIQSSGQPGSDGAALRVRGIGSINASSSPLVIIDGVEGNINGIDANDIESISVLKDAGAAAIYGNRGSNGVILVTTKRAKAGQAKVNYNTYMGFQQPTNQPKMVDAITYLETVGDDALLQQYRDNPNDKDNFPDTDWVDLLFSESGFTHYHNVSVSGGNETLRSKASLSYQDQDGNIPGFGFKRYQGRINTDFTVSPKIDISLDLNFRRSISESSPSGTGVNAVYRQPAIFPAIYSDGTYAFPSTGGNPIAGVKLAGSNTSESNYFRGLLRAVFRPVKGLTLSASYSPEHGDTYGSNFRLRYPAYETFGGTPTYISAGTNNQTTLSQSNSRNFTDNFYSTALYETTFGDHDFRAMLGYEMIKYSTNSFSASRFDYIIQDFEILNNGNAENDGNSGTADHNGLESYFGRLNYIYKGKYLFEVNVRRDGSSRFAPANRWGTFPSVSVGWRIIEEPFLASSALLSNLKLRGSWGQLGNQSIGSTFPYASLIAIGSSHFANGEIQQGAAQQVLSNPSISWETAEKINVGVEFGLLDQRLTGSLEYYDNKTKDLLGVQRVSAVAGLGSPVGNVFSMKNTGFELELEWRDKIGDDFSYNVGGNIATVKNEVTDLNGEDFLISGNSITKVGEAAFSIFGYESEGIFQSQDEIDAAPTQFGALEPGDIRYKDQLTVDTNNDGIPDEADGVINLDDRVILGNSFPSFTYAINAGLTFKGFDFSVAAIGVGDREVFLQRNLVQPLFNAGNIQEYHLTESWTPENPDARFPIIKPYSGGSNNSRTNSTYLFDASYLRIRNITLGYNLPRALLSNTFMEQVRVYATGQNLFTFNKDLPEGIDPLIPNNSQGHIYPIVVSYTFGVNVTF